MPGPPPPVASENDISPTVPPLPTITRRLNKPPVAGSCTNTAGAYARMNPPPPPHVGWPTPQSSDQQATPPPAPHIVTFSSTAVQEDARISFGRGTGWYSPVKVKLYEKGAERAHGFALAGVDVWVGVIVLLGVRVLVGEPVDVSERVGVTVTVDGHTHRAFTNTNPWAPAAPFPGHKAYAPAPVLLPAGYKGSPTPPGVDNTPSAYPAS